MVINVNDRLAGGRIMSGKVNDETLSQFFFLIAPTGREKFIEKVVRTIKDRNEQVYPSKFWCAIIEIHRSLMSAAHIAVYARSPEREKHQGNVSSQLPS